MTKARIAKSLDTLRSQLNKLSPNRSTKSDGWIGDTAHSHRKSDHNVNKADVVQALDITNDPAHGVNSRALAQALLDSRDKRLKYVISNGQIASGAGGPSPWEWRHYDGANKHTLHMHLSVEDSPALYDDDKKWKLPGFEVGAKQAGRPEDEDHTPLLRMGDKGDYVRQVQQLLNRRNAGLEEDGDFGEKTDAAVRKFQEASGLVDDGVVGDYTWRKLLII